jgi:S1-C subfamily serine protease
MQERDAAKRFLSSVDHALKPGDTVDLTYERGGARHTTTLTLSAG